MSKLNLGALLLFIFWLPLNDDYLPAIIALWIISWLIEYIVSKRLFRMPEVKYYAGFLFYFFLTSMQSLRSRNFDNGLFEIQEKLSMIFFPFILALSNEKIQKNIKYILITFIAANFIASIYCLLNAFINSIVIENGAYKMQYFIYDYKIGSFWGLINSRDNHFSYIFLSIFKHPSYFSMYITFSIIIIINLFRKGLIKKILMKILFSLLIAFFIFMLYLLQSRAAFITFGIILVIIPLIELKKKLKKRFIFLTFTLFIAAISFVSTSSRMKGNLSDFNDFLKSKNKTELLKSDIRLQLWYTSIKVIEKNFWFGTSPANLTNELVKEYKKLGFEEAADDKLNTHNQYLETFAGLGFFGFLSLLFIIIYTFILSIKKRNYLLFFLMLILSINFLFEAMLNRMAGILFMMFFISLLVFTKNPPLFENLTDNQTREKDKKVND